MVLYDLVNWCVIYVVWLVGVIVDEIVELEVVVFVVVVDEIV